MFKSFSFHVIIRVIAILVLGYAMIYFWVMTEYWTISIWGIIIVIFLVADLIHYVQRVRREMFNFLVAIRQGDFTNTTSVTGKSHLKNDLKKAQNEIIKVFQHLRIEKASDHHYLKTMVEHIHIAIICFDGEGEVKLLNQAASDLFQKPYLKNIKGLESIDKELVTRMRELHGGDRSLIKLIVNGRFMRLSLLATSFKLKEIQYKIVSFQDIKNELEQHELDSWQKLIRVMTHEIMNSAIPLANLTEISRETIIDESGSLTDITKLDEEDQQDLKDNLFTIQNRSRGLVKFISAYNSLTKIPEPQFIRCEVKELLANVRTLTRREWQESGVEVEVSVSREVDYLIADQGMIEQVLLNLVLNALESLKNRPKPKLQLMSYKIADNQLIIEVKDNGIGIKEEVIENIFVPFFTTRKSGSGIGLSLSRQIMRLHKGRIEVKSEEGIGSSFFLIF